MILARKPDVIVELRYGDLGSDLDLSRQAQIWNVLGAVPAVRNRRVYAARRRRIRGARSADRGSDPASG